MPITLVDLEASRPQTLVDLLQVEPLYMDSSHPWQWLLKHVRLSKVRTKDLSDKLG